MTAPTIEELAESIDGIDARIFVQTVRQFNESVRRDIPFNPNVLDGRMTEGIDPPKMNWAIPLEAGPFEAYQVTCGITFTFGGLRTDTDARVIDGDGRPVPSLYVCGEMLGGLFYLNYPGGSGLTAGAVFGHTAGRNAARATTT